MYPYTHHTLQCVILPPFKDIEIFSYDIANTILWPPLGFADDIAFTVYLSSDREVTSGTIVGYNQVILNRGNDYSTSTHKFTCPYSGVYLFHVSVVSKPGKQAWLRIVKDRSYIAAAVADDGDDISTESSLHDSSASSLGITYCAAGEMVWVEAINTASFNGHSNPYNSFSGVLLKRL